MAKLGVKDVGVYLDGSCSRTADELSAAIVELAEGQGFEPGAYDAEFIHEVADEAIEWLNSNVVDLRSDFRFYSEGVMFTLDDGLVLVEVEED